MNGPERIWVSGGRHQSTPLAGGTEFIRADIAAHQSDELREALEWGDELFATIAALRDGGVTNPQLEEAYAGYAKASNAWDRHAPSPVAGPDAATVERDEWLRALIADLARSWGNNHKDVERLRTLRAYLSAASPITDTAGRNEIQRWRNDAFEASAGIVESYFGKDGEYCAADIRALKRSVLTDTDRMAKMEDAQSRVECSRCGAYDATGAFIKHCDERACPMRRNYDVCYCGDYRRDHLNGTGACRLNGLGHGLGAATAGECTEFRLASIAAIEAATEGEKKETCNG